jgi:hypothetical protein
VRATYWKDGKLAIRCYACATRECAPPPRAQATAIVPVDGRYIRFGELPHGGFSTDYSTGTVLRGVSVFWAGQPVDGLWTIAGCYSGIAEGSLRHFIAQRRNVYLVSGREVGIGPDGEPLITDVAVISRLIWQRGGFVVA